MIRTRDLKPGHSSGMMTIAWLALVCSGCSEETGAPPYPGATGRVTGRAIVGGIPISGGWLELIPTDGTAGDLRSSPLGPDGSFAIDRAAAGAVAVRIIHPPTNLESRIPRDVRLSFSSLVRLQVEPNREERVVIDVLSGKTERLAE